MEQIHFPKGVGRRHVAFLVLAFLSSSARTGRRGGTMSGPRLDVAPGRCGQKELLGSRALRGSNPMISSSQASSGASVCVVRSRNVLCGERRTRSWKLKASVSVMLHSFFLGLG